MDSQIVQDLLPGTGSLGSVPMHHDYKREVIRPAPKEFNVEVLDPKKFGSGHCYGIRILPVAREVSDTRSIKSSKTDHSNSEYEVWRRWEDCLWFQDLLETEYKLMARTKRTRLAQGKGIKKDGVYMHSDQAASFDSLPPGPDANDIAKDIHKILPKLTKKATLFRAGQSTIEQRAREFSALIDALFQDDVPMLIRELRANRMIRDFFAYWRRDKDHERKIQEGSSPHRMSRISITSSAFSMYFSSSKASLSLPNSDAEIPPPPLPSIPQDVKGKKIVKAASLMSMSSSSSSSSSGSSRSSQTPRTPVSAPSGLSFTVSADGNLIPTTPLPDDSVLRAGPSSAPSLRSPPDWRSSARSTVPSSFAQDDAVAFVSDTPWTESFDIARTGRLQPLPEERELITAAGNIALPNGLRQPPRRPRKQSCPEPSVRNCVVFTNPPKAPLPLSLDTSSTVNHAAHPLPPSPLEVIPETPMTRTSSSCHSSVALTSFSGERSQRSSWRTSIGSIPDDFPDVPRDMELTAVDLDDFLCDASGPLSPDSPVLKEHFFPRASIATMNSIISNSSVDAVLPRSSSPVSSADRYATAVYPVPISDAWDEQHEELIDAYFYDPSLYSAVPPSPLLSGQITPGRERSSTYPVSTPDRFPKPFQNRPPGQFHLPWTPVKSPRISTLSLSPPGSSNGDIFTIKAVRHDSIVLLRASYSMSFLQVREKIREKFLATGGPPLTDAFTVGFAPSAAEDRGPTVYSRPRSQSTSAIRQDSKPRLRFLTSDEDWQTAISTCTGKLTVHIFDRF